MNGSWQSIRAVSVRAVRRFLPNCALLGGPLLLLLFIARPAPAQVSKLQSLFDGVRRGTATPEVAGAAETLPPPSSLPAASSRIEGNVPMSGWDADVDISQGRNGRIDRLVVRDASLSKVLALLAQTYNLNIVASNDIDAIISITLRDVALEEALTAILSVANYTWVEQNGIILITSLSDGGQLAPEVQGRQLQVFELDFASASVLQETVDQLKSPIGNVSIVESDSTDNRRTREMIVVEDVPESLARIANYIYQVDCPPRQVLLEAHVLEITLDDKEKNGVNFDALARAAGADIHIKTVDFAPTIAGTNASTGFFATVNGGDLTGVIELLQTTTDTKSLGSPKILVLNQQRARIQVGDDIGYNTTVTTELQSTQEVQFLHTGVVLELIPRITRDNCVLLHVRPEVSSGAFNLATQAPDKRTTEISTDVMLRDGQGMIIGGLIREDDDTRQSKIPYLGDLWRVGFLFRKSDVTKKRIEVIIAVVPRIQPYAPDYAAFEQGELVKAETPLFEGPLDYVDRPFDAQLPDGKRVARPYIPTGVKIPQVDPSVCNDPIAPWPRYYVPHKPYPVQDFSGSDRGNCVEPMLEHPLQYADEGPQLSDEFVPEYDGYGEEYGNSGQEMSIISDQP